MNEQFYYTVIIPHYNSRGLLARALDSIPRRHDIQVIVVDDMSTEKCIREVSQSEKYSHVRFIFSSTKLTGGGARNKGLALASGNYILFLDADDYFTEDAFNVFDIHISQGLDLFMFKVCSFLEDTKEHGTRHLYLEDVYKKKGLTKFVSNDQPYAKMIKRSFIEKNRIQFQKAAAGDDIYFSTQVSLYSKSRLYVPSLVYQISQNNFSVTATMNDEKECSELEQYTKKVKLIRKNTSILFSTYYLAKRNKLKRYFSVVADESANPYLRASAKAYIQAMPFLVLLWFRLFRRLKAS